MDSKQIAETGLIIKAITGSTLHGTSVGSSDNDRMGVCIEPPNQVFSGNFEQYRYRDKPEGVKSDPGDEEGTIYGLRKYMRLATKGNPTILELLFVPTDFLVFQNELGYELQQLAPYICSQQALPAFLGYLRAQRQRLTGERRGHVPSRPELIEKYGYDTKYASHALRLGFLGVELAATGRLEFPMPLGYIMKDVRRGLYEYEQVLDLIDTQISVLSKYKDGTYPIKSQGLREYPDMEKINEFLLYAYILSWKRDYGLVF